MGRVTWRPEALADIEQIELFISRDSTTYARLLVRRLIAATVRLGEFPDSGRVVREVGNQNVREVIVRSYRVIYRVWPDEVEVIAVVHGARLIGEEDIPE